MTHDTGREVLDEIAALYGELPAPRGVVHVVSAARGADGLLHVLTIDQHAPRSETDFFALQLCRARADAVITSAQILRKEPELGFAFVGPWASGLTRYRHDVLHKRALTCVILSRSGDLPLQHALFREVDLERVLVTSEQGARALPAEAARHAQVIALAEPGVPAAIAHMFQAGKSSISIEAGPSTVHTLYGASSPIDELWLSRVEHALPPERLAGALPADDALFAGRRLASEVTRDELSGRWRFQRWVRASAPETAEKMPPNTAGA
jgi:riboflavin biosynthesis pyrimidine reductase